MMQYQSSRAVEEDFFLVASELLLLLKSQYRSQKATGVGPTDVCHEDVGEFLQSWSKNKE